MTNNPVYNTRIQLKTDTSTNWAKATNFKPKAGELVYYSDIKRIKIGDGTTAVSALPFVGGYTVTNPALTATDGCFTWTIDAKVKPSYVNIYSSAGEQVRCDITLTNTGATIKMYRSDVTSLVANSFYAVVG